MAFPRRFFGNRFFPGRYFGHSGLAAVVGVPAGHESDVRLYSSNGLRKLLPDVDEIDFEYLERGGYGQGSVSLLATWEEVQLTGNERIDVYLLGEFAYRGYIRINQNDIADPERANFTFYGLIELMDRWRVTRKYAYGCAVDLSQVFTDLIDDYVDVSDRKLGIVIDAQAVGVTIKDFDATGKSVAQAINQLCDFAPGQCIWGSDVDASLNDRVYFRPKNLLTEYTHIIGKNVTAFIYPRDTSTIVNRAFITGGPVTQPNLAPNGSFEQIAPSSAEVNNYLLDYSFEDGTPSAQWTLAGGATVKTVGDATAHGSARTGKRWLELDGNGETAKQTFNVNYLQQYFFSMWCRYEDAVLSVGRQVTVIIEGLNAALAVVTTDTLIAYFDPESAVYTEHTAPFDFLLFSTVVKARITIETNAGTASNDGILVDDVGVWPDCSEGQQCWRMNLTGAATLNDLDWDIKSSPTPKHGGYSVKLHPANIAGSSDYMDIAIPKVCYPSVAPNERYTLLVWWQTAGGGSTSFSIGVTPIKTDGTQDTVQQSATITGNPSVWTLQTLDIQTGTDTAQLQIFLRARANTAIYFDAVMLVQGELPQDVTDYSDYWAGADYELVAAANDDELAGLLDPVVNDVFDRFIDQTGQQLEFHFGEIDATWSPNIDFAHLGYGVITRENRLRPNDTLGDSSGLQFASGQTETTEYDVDWVLHVKTLISQRSPGGVARLQETAASATLNYYAAYYNHGATRIELRKSVAGAVTTLGTYTVTLVAGETYRFKLRVLTTGVKLFLEGVERVTSTDTTISLQPKGHAGVIYPNSGAAFTDEAGYHLDNFRVHEVSDECNPEYSIANFGEREADASNEDIKNHSLAVAFAESYFKANSCPRVQASLTVKGPVTLMKQEGAVRLVNLPDPPPPLFPSRIQYRINGAEGIVMTAELGNERPELATLFAKR